MGHRALVARHFPIDPLLIGVAPAGVHPDLCLDPGELAVARRGLEFELGINTIGRMWVPAHPASTRSCRSLPGSGLRAHLPRIVFRKSALPRGAQPRGS